MIGKLIDVNTSPRIGEKEYSGICLLANDKVLLLLNFNDESAQFEGFTLIRNNDFESYCEWEEEDFDEIKHDNSKELMRTIDPNNFNSFESALQTRKSTLIAFYTDDDLDSYYVGKVIELKNNTLTLHLINEDAEWINIIDVDLNTIWYIGFDTEYERQLLKNAH